jgi:hypothetical protein
MISTESFWLCCLEPHCLFLSRHSLSKIAELERPRRHPNPEARIGKQIIDLSAQVASPREAQPERIETLLPARHARLRSAPMLHEQQTLSQQPSAGHAGGNLLEHLHPFPELALGEKQKTFNLQKIGKINRT